jgi:hypothetical protein
MGGDGIFFEAYETPKLILPALHRLHYWIFILRRTRNKSQCRFFSRERFPRRDK